MNEVHVFVGADEKYVMPMTIALHSVLSHLDRETKAYIYIFNGGICENSQNRVKRVLENARTEVSIKWLNFDSSKYEGINVGRYSTASLFRFEIVNYLPLICDRALYLDSDVVVTGNITELWKLNLEEKPFWAVESPKSVHFKQRIADKFPECDFPSNALYLNSGVLLINVDQWRRLQITDDTYKFLHNHGHKLSFPDQDALNAVAAGMWGQLDPRWNMQRHTGKNFKGAKGIMHYTTGKPWTRHFTGTGRWIFFSAYLRSGWDKFPISFVKVGMLAGEQIVRRNFMRIRRKLGQMGIWSVQ